MKESIKTLVSNCAQQMDMTHKACKQTSAMEVGLVSETGKVLNDNKGKRPWREMRKGIKEKKVCI